jgi:hypothetical protein
MNLIKEIEDWQEYPNALGSESQVAVIIGKILSILNKEMPGDVRNALKILSLRSTMRDIANAMMKENMDFACAFSSDYLTEIASLSCGLSWAESLVIITKYLEECKKELNFC